MAEEENEIEDETLSPEDEGESFDSEEMKRRIAARKKKQLESEDFTTTPSEQEEKKRNATETEFQ